MRFTGSTGHCIWALGVRPRNGHDVGVGVGVDEEGEAALVPRRGGTGGLLYAPTLWIGHPYAGRDPAHRDA